MTIADSDAVRARRARKHKAGDHSLCRRCPAVRGEPGRPRGVVLLPPSPAVPVDPLASLEDLARRLEAAHEADPANALLARELRMTLRELIGIEGSGSGRDDLAAEYGPA